MATPTHPALQRILHLDVRSLDYANQLDNVLHGDDYEGCVSRLARDDQVWLMNYLDNALERLDDSHRASRKCLRELRTICRSNMTLPPSCQIPPNILTCDPCSVGSGGYGEVFEGALNGTRVCVKRLRIPRRKDLDDVTKMLCGEAAIWKHLKHPNILPFLGAIAYPPRFVSDWASGGDLPEYIQTHPNANRIQLSDAAKGLEYLHFRNVIHGDLKGSNILVEVINNSPRAWLADFGFTFVTPNPESRRPPTQQSVFNGLWSAPEVLMGGNPSRESDVYSFAMVTTEVLTDQALFDGRTDWAAAAAIMDGERPPRPAHASCTDTLWTVIQCSWERDPHLRPKISEVSNALAVLVAPQNQG